MSVNVRMDMMHHGEIFGKPILYTNWFISRDTVPDGWYCYDLCGLSKRSGRAATLKDRAEEDHVGTVLSPVPLKKPDTRSRQVRGTFFLYGKLLDLEGFCEAHALDYPQETRKYILRPAFPDEADLFFSAIDPEEDRELACVGHLRLDFGRKGDEFWHSWWQHNNDELNTPVFKADLEQVMAELRERGPLKDLDAMASYCFLSPLGRLDGEDRSYAYIAESEGYRYCLRCIPRRGDYNGYLYIYDKRQQELNMAVKQKNGLTEAGKQALLDAADPTRPHTYDWFVIEGHGRRDEQLHGASSLTDAIDRYNGLACDSKRLGVTKDKIATIDLVIAEGGIPHLDEEYHHNPRFAEDSMISEAIVRLQLSIAGLDRPGQNMTMGGV